MKILQTEKRCTCSVCSRRLPRAVVAAAAAPLVPSAPLPTDSEPAAAADVEEGEDEDEDTPALAPGLEAGPSSEPQSPSPATLLPNEILELIFNLARPRAKTASPSLWASFARLSQVCATWAPAAQRSLGEHVVLFDAHQIRLLSDALDDSDDHAGTVDGDRVQSLQLHFTTDKSANRIDLRRIIERCPNLATLRLTGFGERAWVDDPTFFRSVTETTKLKTIEYSAVDHSGPPSTEAVAGWLHDVPTLQHLELSSHLVPLALHPTLLPSLPPPRANLVSLSLNAVRIDVVTLATLTASSLSTLRTLALRESYLIAHDAGLLLAFFTAIGPQLESLTWENKLHPLVGGPPTSTEWWSLISQCTALRHLAVFSHHVFQDRPTSFRLPLALEELSIGTRGTLAASHVWAYLDLATVSSSSCFPTPSTSSPLTTFSSLSNPASLAVPTTGTPSAERRSRRGRRDRERAREKGKRHLSGASTPTTSYAAETVTSLPVVVPAAPTRLAKLALWSDGERWAPSEEQKLARQGSARGVQVSWYRLHIVTVDVLEQTAELRRASSR
ncbi:hypothetical protein RQP46_001092 [Phenoliferia psychrophenolica]